MEIKAELKQPYTDEERTNFIVKNNHNFGYEIEFADNAIIAWGYTEEEQEQRKRERLDLLTLTPADVERALYKAKGMDFEDLKALIAEKIPTIDLKALAIEFRAKDFYRGATITVPALYNSNGSVMTYRTIRLFDEIGKYLNLRAEDIDFLFENKELPVN